MKIKTKVKAGRGCGGGSTPDIQSSHTRQRPHHPGHTGNGAPYPQQEMIMKIKTKVKAGRGCGGTPDIQSSHATQRPHHPGHAGNGASLSLARSTT